MFFASISAISAPQRLPLRVQRSPSASPPGLSKSEEEGASAAGQAGGSGALRGVALDDEWRCDDGACTSDGQHVWRCVARWKRWRRVRRGAQEGRQQGALGGCSGCGRGRRCRGRGRRGDSRVRHVTHDIGAGHVDHGEHSAGVESACSCLVVAARWGVWTCVVGADGCGEGGGTAECARERRGGVAMGGFSTRGTRLCYCQGRQVSVAACRERTCAACARAQAASQNPSQTVV